MAIHVDKPWGYETYITTHDTLASDITVNAGARSSLHFYPNRQTVITVIGGTGGVVIYYGNPYQPTSAVLAKAGETVTIEPGTAWRLVGPASFVETSSHPHDVAVRVADDYGRA